MNKKELLSKTALESGTTQDTAKKVIASFIEIIKKSLNRGETVTVRGFGRFYLKNYPGRTIKTAGGAEYQISDRKVPAFRPGKVFKDQCNPKRL